MYFKGSCNITEDKNLICEHSGQCKGDRNCLKGICEGLENCKNFKVKNPKFLYQKSSCHV